MSRSWIWADNVASASDNRANNVVRSRHNRAISMAYASHSGTMSYSQAIIANKVPHAGHNKR